MSLLSIIQTAADRLSLRRPSAVITSTDQQVRQLLALANEEGYELAKATDWQSLKAEWLFVTVAAEVQTNTPIPPDLAKLIPGSFFNRTTAREIIGPITSRQYQAFKAQPVTGLIYLSYRERAGQFLCSPAPAAGETIAYEYVSNAWARSSAGAAKVAFTSDDDTSYLEEELIIKGIRWRFKAANGLDYAEDMRSYELAVQQAKGEDGGAPILSVGRSYRDPVTMRPNVPEGGFGL